MPAVPAGALTRDVKTEVLVVGMGVSGAMIAEALTADGHKVVAIDRRGPAKGSTAANTALVLHEIDNPLSELAKKIGKHKAQRAWRRSLLSVFALRHRIEELGIDCDLNERPALYLSGTELGAQGLKEETEARREAGIPALYLSRPALAERFGIDRAGAIISNGNLALDPRKLTSGLFHAAAQRGARFYSHCEATTFEHTKESVTVGTKDGPAITAKYVVLATGYELAAIVSASQHQVVSTWAIATKPQPRAYPREQPMIWEASDPYLYIRTTSDGRVICGGEDEEFADEERRDALLPAKTERLSEKLQKLLPGIDVTPEFAWSGSFGSTADGLPMIGKVPRHPRVFAVMGYGGNGTTWSQLASDIVRTAMRGGKDADADLFSFG